LGKYCLAGYNHSDEEDIMSEKLGGWSEWSYKISSDAQDVFDRALKGFVGVKYETPSAYATQSVAGTNYCFLCEAQVVYPDALPYPVLLYIYQPPTGNPCITGIKKIVP
jgi:hypothetical protein